MAELLADKEKDICPLCGKKEYISWEGDEVDVGVGMIQVSPDMYECLYCGFEDQEQCEHSEEELIAKHKKKIRKDIKDMLKYIRYMINKI